MSEKCVQEAAYYDPIESVMAVIREMRAELDEPAYMLELPLASVEAELQERVTTLRQQLWSTELLLTERTKLLDAAREQRDKAWAERDKSWESERKVQRYFRWVRNVGGVLLVAFLIALAVQR